MSQHAYPSQIAVTFQTVGRQNYSRKLDVASTTVGDIAKTYLELSGSKDMDDIVLLYSGSQIRLNDERNVKDLFKYDIFPIVIVCPA